MDSRQVVLSVLENQGGELTRDDLTLKVQKKVEQMEAEVGLKFVPQTGIQVPRSRTLNRTLSHRQGSGLIEQDGELVLLTEKGRRRTNSSP